MTKDVLMPFGDESFDDTSLLSQVRLAISKSHIVRRKMLEVSKHKYLTGSPHPVHLALGHERLASAVSSVRTINDMFSLTHRNIHFNLALADVRDIQRIIDEALGSLDGINQGRYGCMTMRNPKSGVYYTSSILGNNIPVGLGLASKALLDDSVVWIQVGDGSIEEGVFYESLVFASARFLPVVFLLENNNWSLGTSIPERRQPIKLSMFCQALSVDYHLISQHSTMIDICQTLNRARSTALAGSPTLVECTLLTQGGVLHPKRGYVSYHHGTLPSKT